MRSQDSDKLISEWWNAFKETLLGRANRLTGDPEAARDLVQEVALALLMQDKPFQNEEHFKRWTFQKLKWFALDELKKIKQEKVLFVNEAKTDLLTEHPPQETDQAIRELRKAIETLPERQRDVTVRYYIQDHSVREIARELHIEESTVRSLLRHARSALAERLGTRADS